MDTLIATVDTFEGVGPSPNFITRTSDGILYAVNGAYGNATLDDHPIQVYKSTDNGWNWELDVEYSPYRAAQNSGYRAAIAVDGNDKVHLAFGYHKRNTWDIGFLGYATKPKGGSWSGLTNIATYTPPTYASSANAVYSMVVDGLNQVHILYLVYQPPWYFEHHWYDGSWHKERVFGGGFNDDAMLAVDPDNTIYQVYDPGDHYAKKDNIPTEVEDTYDPVTLSSGSYTVVYNRMEFNFAGTLREVKVKTKTAGDYTLRIKSDDGTTTYQTHTIEGASADSWITFDIDELEIAAGDKYRMEVTRPSGQAYRASGLYGGTFWKNNKAGFNAAEYDETTAMGFVLLQKSGWSINAIPDILADRVCCDKDGNLHFCNGTQYKRLRSDGGWDALEEYYGGFHPLHYYKISVTQDGIVHILGNVPNPYWYYRHWQRSVAGVWSWENVQYYGAGTGQGSRGATLLHAIFPVHGSYYPCLLGDGYAFVSKSGGYNLRFAADPEIPPPPYRSQAYIIS